MNAIRKSAIFYFLFSIFYPMLTAGVTRAQAPGPYVDLHDFGENSVLNAGGSSGPDGIGPSANIVFDGAGNMYGTAMWGGATGGSANLGDGMVWEITTSQNYKDLHDFGETVTYADGKSGPDGAANNGTISSDGVGNIYGTASGGANNGGMVWEITKSGTYLDLHDFGGTVTNAGGKNGPDGTGPIGVTIDDAGNMYGTASGGGVNGDGIVWEITAAGTYRDLHDFGGAVTTAADASGPDGRQPLSGVTRDGSGNLYGTAFSGGANDFGVVWEISASGAYKDLHDFGGTTTNADGTKGPDGASTQAVVTFDSSGNLYGTTSSGGPNSYDPANNQFGSGMVWEITLTGAYKDLHDFGGTVTTANGTSGPDGIGPQGGLTLDAGGNMYGATQNGGPNQVLFMNGETAGAGMVWEIASSGEYKDLHDFGGNVTNAGGYYGPDGFATSAGVTLDSEGNLYGTVVFGGPNASVYQLIAGLAWEISAAVPAAPILTAAGGDANVLLNWTSSRATTVYRVYRGTAPGAEVNPALAVGLATTRYIDTSVAVGATYYYKVTAVNDFGASSYSNEAVAAVTGPIEPAPMISPNGGTFSSEQSVTITDTLGNASIYYTTDGSTPTALSTPYSGPIAVSTSETIKAIAIASGYENSAVTSVAFTIYLPTPTPVMTPNGGTFATAQQVTITDSVYGALIYYTTDGSTPTTISTPYTGPITVAATETIQAVAVASGDASSDVASASFTIDASSHPTAPTPSISSNGGTFTGAQSVTISDALPGATIYYAINSVATTASTTYTGPITISSSETVSAIALVPGYEISAPASSSFTINSSAPPPPVASFNSGLQMISLPYGYAGVGLGTLFGYSGVKLAVWDSVGNTYAITPTAPANQVVLGQGYWVRFPQSVTVTTAGTPAPTNAPFDIPLQAGWNMIGDPFTTAVTVSSLTFNHGADTFAQATTSSPPLIGATVWTYDTATNAYAPATSLEPNTGYWLFASGATDMGVSDD